MPALDSVVVASTRDATLTSSQFQLHSCMHHECIWTDGSELIAARRAHSSVVLS